MNLLRAVVVLALCLGCRSSPRAGEPVQFNRDIRPILSDNCFACHGFDSNKRKADMRLDVFSDALYTDEILVPGSPEKSALYQRINASDHDDVMPPQDSGKALTPEQKTKLHDWIAQGAKFEKHWAYIPAKRPRVPGVLNRAWPRNAIDHFILAKLEATQLEPAEPAPPHILARRLYFDLIGLPPSPEAVYRFASAKSPDVASLVDNLLARPQFGERMAIHWLDLVRYGDSNGYHADLEWSVFPYRDYVIRAFNENQPFD
ncbi:MAG: DUF1549 domain-containing protein, partial [Verrucomicrobiota bacterium]|nr:DUF1549 domain-containing protein [Verrucomicrobiota bacterium]